MKAFVIVVSLIFSLTCDAASLREEGEAKWKAGDCAGAFEDFMEAAKLNVACAFNDLGVVRAHGCPAANVPLNPSEALKMYESAGLMGCARGYTNAGDAYLSGVGVPKDVQKAADDFALGAQLGDSVAKKKLQALGNPSPSKMAVMQMEVQTREPPGYEKKIQRQLDQIKANDAKIRELEATIADADRKMAEADRAAVAQAEWIQQQDAMQNQSNAFAQELLRQQQMRNRAVPAAVAPPIPAIRVPAAPSMSTIQSPALTGTQSVPAGGCDNDFECGAGRVCMRAASQIGLQGTCVTPVDRSGVPQFPMQQGTPTNVRGCQFDTDCAVGFRCSKRANELTGICVR